MKKAENDCHVTGLEKVKKAHFTTEMFSMENDMLTPTFKIKRNVAKKVYEKEIKEMYDGGEIARS